MHNTKINTFVVFYCLFFKIIPAAILLYLTYLDSWLLSASFSSHTVQLVIMFFYKCGSRVCKQKRGRAGTLIQHYQCKRRPLHSYRAHFNFANLSDWLDPGLRRWERYSGIHTTVKWLNMILFYRYEWRLKFANSSTPKPLILLSVCLRTGVCASAHVHP